jgi:hypothetical protein
MYRENIESRAHLKNSKYLFWVLNEYFGLKSMDLFNKIKVFRLRIHSQSKGDRNSFKLISLNFFDKNLIIRF